MHSTGFCRPVPGLRGLRLLDCPDGGLGPTAVPMAGLALPYCVPARFVLPVIITAADHQARLVPDNLAANDEPCLLQPLRLFDAAQAAVPHIGDLAGE